MIGVLVYGDNHFIVDGPQPDGATAKALAIHWSLIRINASTPQQLSAWKIINKAFREDLQWAVVVPASSETSPAIVALLGELRKRGIPSTHAAD